MTVSTDDIALVSPFTVGVSGDFSTDDFNVYKTWAGLELDRLDPGVDAETYDQCHALLICHIYDISPQSKKTGFKSEKIGDYSYTRADTNDVASSSYYIRFQQILALWATEQATTGVERDDTDTTYPKAEFKLDQGAKAMFE